MTQVVDAGAVVADTLANASRVILVRHGLPGDLGVADPGLGDEGVSQARRLGDWLRNEPVAQVVSSHYTRAHETALFAAEPHGLDVVVDERLREWDSDRTTYSTPEAIAETPRGKAFAEARFDDFIPDYDKVELAARMRAAVLEAVERAPGQLTVVASHGGAINTLLTDILQAPSPFFFNPGYTSMSRIAVMRSGRFVIETVNETAHLR
ncbi:histidine phosphatase family protein [Williamsia sp. 1138]|uniref:histidine phosphatase family protein n=1 Tax=Williamsia sp. 1138 TaxID=1903117 RepID=UPI000A11EAE5|nr:histidine phosphatase family protein [Williamsia sp. 1138]OZG27448.1 histidine phosphatase family protein [Williamsia sp. 1138]